jgi:F0F1-type ATP synthase delta subunit
MISSKNLAEAIYSISQENRHNNSIIIEEVLSYIKKYKLESLIPKVICYLEDKVNKNSKWNTLNIETNLKIEDDLLNKISRKLNAENAKFISTNINGKLIGGFVATYKGIIYDASIYNQLQLLKKSLTK